ncbi:MAG: hypothetical protein K9H65_01080 [Bacteroidales bacterium]|nr:hypothetical protein [Bacteroidales bacterium]
MNKTKLFEVPQAYTAALVKFNGQDYIVGGPEGESPLKVYNLANSEISEIVDAQGGTMSIIKVPGMKNTLVSSMGMFPPFKGKDANIFLHRHLSDGWHSEKIFHFPFSHRCEILTVNDTRYLFVASVSTNKESPEDWSNPGEVRVARVNDSEPWLTDMEVIIDNLFKNHGMTKVPYNGTESVMVSGAEGIFSITPGSGGWKTERIFDQEVSEFVFYDLNEDGINELVTIEPFHGNTLNVYNNKGSNWERIYQSPLSFGHGLGVGHFEGVPTISVGNRRENSALEMHTMEQPGQDKIVKNVIEEGVGPTLTNIVKLNSRDTLLSVNQLKNEIALYHQ